jgi:CTP:molybdopterin cytidylyltransferase MocA
VPVDRRDLCALVLAAGAGTRLRPLTDELPKAMCPVGNRPLVDWALDRVARHVDPEALAVNAHGSQPVLAEHAARRAHVSVEQGERLGTAGALGRLRPWIDGRAVLLHNADSFVEDDLETLVSGWDGDHPRLLVRRDAARADFDGLRYLGVSLLPARYVDVLPDEPSGLYSLVWRPEHDAGTLELVEASGTSIDCGTPADYLAANLHVSGGGSVVDPAAEVLGSIERCVVWAGARVGPGERLVDAVRTPLHTVRCAPPSEP